MKKIILSTLLLSSTFIYAESFHAKLVNVKLFKGDLNIGNMNTCKKFLILETYDISNTSLNGLVISHTINNDSTVLRKREYKEVGTNYISYPFCVSSRYYTANIKTKFMNAEDKQSNTVEFKIDTTNLVLQDANQYPHHKKIK